VTAEFISGRHVFASAFDIAGLFLFSLISLGDDK